MQGGWREDKGGAGGVGKVGGAAAGSAAATAKAGGAGRRGQTVAGQDGGEENGQGLVRASDGQELKEVQRGTVPALYRHAQPFLAQLESRCSLARPSSASQSAFDMRCKIAGDPRKACRPSQPQTRREIAALTGSGQGVARGDIYYLIGPAQAHLTRLDST